jgi:hypothetical protein
VSWRKLSSTGENSFEDKQFFEEKKRKDER